MPAPSTLFAFLEHARRAPASAHLLSAVLSVWNALPPDIGMQAPSPPNVICLGRPSLTTQLKIQTLATTVFPISLPPLFFTIEHIPF